MGAVARVWESGQESLHSELNVNRDLVTAEKGLQRKTHKKKKAVSH